MKIIKNQATREQVSRANMQNIHDKNILSSIETNIIGTCNVVRACSEKNIKLIYFLTLPNS